VIVKLIVLYPPPADADSFEVAFVEERVPQIMRAANGLTRFVLAKCLWGVDGPLPYHMLAELTFPSLEALQTGLPPAAIRPLLRHESAAGGDKQPIAFVCVEERIWPPGPTI